MNRTNPTTMQKWIAISIGAACLILLSFINFWPSKVDYNEDIRPIINRKCISCHGGVKKQGGVSFLFREEALEAGESGKPAIVPGNPEASELMVRIRHSDAEERMPLEADPLSEEEIKLFERWIKEGAEWKDHWSYVLPARPSVPSRGKKWSSQAIDRFVYDKLRTAGLKPAPEADKVTLARRVALDLTGLPPKPEWVDRYLKDTDKGAYERLVDTLLASPHFGERWAAMWLDLARYADTKGYERDPHRDIWPYRDWVIRAFNTDMPFDTFTIMQLAGDLLPKQDANKLIATAFHRNTMTNTEGGTDDDEYRTVSLIDRINTTWTVWQGTTMECVQCHSHPYDPIVHKDYYKIMDYFNQTQDNDITDDFPVLELYSKKDSLRIAKLMSKIRPSITGESIEKQIKDALLPRRIAGDCDDFGNTLIYYDRVVANWMNNLNAIGNRRFHIAFRQVDMQNIAQISLTYASSGSESNIEIRLDSLNGQVLHDYSVVKTGPIRGQEGGGNIKWRRIQIGIPEIKGKRDVYVMLINRTGNIPAGIVLLKEIELLKAGEKIDPKIRLIQDSLIMMRLRSRQVPIMQARFPVNRRNTRVFERGSWLQPGEPVKGGIPQSMVYGSMDEPGDRMAFAQWLVSNKNPLTARVMVNRFWEQLFGQGIVETTEDFGSQGIKPSHPELLDWLAIAFQDTHKWKVKSLLKQIVLSATYRQSSVLDKEKLEKDPFNKLLSRGPRIRLSAEQLRDQALAVSGLMSNKLYGPSVMPPQPEGVWSIVYSSDRWVESKGSDRVRRGLYTYWRRTSPYPAFVTFDAPSREVCTSRRIRTNTPLQALVVLNDTVYYEAAQTLACEMMEKGSVPSVQIAYGYKKLMYRQPDPRISAILSDLYEDALNKFRRKIDEAQAMSGEKFHLSAEHAALTVTANALFNMDEFLTKN